MNMKKKQELLEYLDKIPPGEVPQGHGEDFLCEMISETWAELGITEVDGLPLPAEKIDNTVHKFSKVEWTPPVISFELERHGAIVGGGSIDAEIYRISLDLKTDAPSRSRPSKRRVKKARPPMDLKKKAEEVVQAVLEEGDHPGIQEKGDLVMIKIGKFIPGGGVAKETLSSRRKKVRGHADEALAELGYEKIANWKFRVPG
jgi:hypothetical protein